MLKVVHVESEPNATGGSVAGSSVLDEIVRDGARQMLAAALQAEVAAYIEAHQHEVHELGRRLVVRNGYHAPREVTTAAGAVPVRQPRVDDRRIDEATGEQMRFASAILPAWARSGCGTGCCSRCSTTAACASGRRWVFATRIGQRLSGRWPCCRG